MTGWTVMLVFVPWLGALIYLITRGDEMGRRGIEQPEASRDAHAQWGTPSPNAAPAAGQTSVDQLTKLAELHQSGSLTHEKFAAQKAEILA